MANPPPQPPFPNGFPPNSPYNQHQHLANGGASNAAVLQPAQFVQGIMNGQRNNYVHVGEQMDLNVLWELVNQLGEVQANIREQQQGVMQRVQMIQARGLDGPVEESTNGTAPKESAFAAEMSSLRQRNSALHSSLSTLSTQNASLTTLLSTYESTLSSLLQKLRPYATHHTQALDAQKAHYLSLLDSERKTNLELRCEITRLQQGMADVLGWVREADKLQQERERGWVKRVAGLRAENRVLRGVSGVGGAESSESSEDEGVFGGPMVVGMRRS